MSAVNHVENIGNFETEDQGRIAPIVCLEAHRSYKY